MVNPAALGATLRVWGGPGEGDTGTIDLPAARWHVMAKGKGFRYVDASGAAGGVRQVVIRLRPRGGLRIAGGRENWGYRVDRPQTVVNVTLTVGTATWCAVLRDGFVRNGPKRVRVESRSAPASCPCEAQVTSTWEAIQTAVFERRGCTQGACHGSSPGQGLLDLRPEVAHAQLVDVPSTAAPSLMRVEPGDRSQSLLWLKLAKATLVDGYENVPLAGMPFGLEPLTADELEAVRLWIQAGAPETGVVPDTAELLNTCLGPPDPIKIRPAPPPAPGEGIQLHAPPWTIPPRNAEGQNGENEVCYATYYDLDAQIPAEFKAPCPDFWGGPTKTCFYTNANELTQDPNSHHSIIHLYLGEHDITHPGFGPMTCHGGEREGEPCDPKGPADQCPGGGCAGAVVSSIACIGYGPPDLDGGTGSGNFPAIGGSQQPHLAQRFPDGVFGMLPTKGIVVWNSHAFNVTDQPATNEQYYNLYFAPAPDRRYWAQFIFDLKDIFVLSLVPLAPFERTEVCSTHTLPRGARVIDLSSHTHKRGKLFRVWGPAITPCRPGPGCEAEPGQAILTTTDYSDPAVTVFDPPLPLDDPDPAGRTFKYCSVYDNGATDSTEVKRLSTSPRFGECQNAALACVNEARRGQPCGGFHKRCDSAPGAGDGVCDACPLVGGVTTEDEMFILLGTYYCPEGSDCWAPAP
jgi:hypothetical protein